MDPTTTTRQFASDASALADETAESADETIRSTQKAANGAFNKLASKVEDVRSQAAPLINRLSGQAEAAARRSVDAVRDTSQQVRAKALRASDSTVTYIKDEPVKAVLIAAATGAALMALISLVTRDRD